MFKSGCLSDYLPEKGPPEPEPEPSSIASSRVDGPTCPTRSRVASDAGSHALIGAGWVYLLHLRTTVRKVSFRKGGIRTESAGELGQVRVFLLPRRLIGGICIQHLRIFSTTTASPSGGSEVLGTSVLPLLPARCGVPATDLPIRTNKSPLQPGRGEKNLTSG